MVKITPLLQREFPGENDCTLTAITAVLASETGKSPNLVYGVVKQYAKDYLYQDSFGTVPIFHKIIYQKSCDEFGIQKKVKSGYMRGLGYSFETLRNLTNNGVPVILSMHHYDRRTYWNHTVTVINTIDEGRRLLVYDNWNLTYQVIDYDKISVISCVVF